jgi:signal transduction histidine kinase
MIQFVKDGRELWAAADGGIRRWTVDRPRAGDKQGSLQSIPQIKGGEIIPGTESQEIESFHAMGDSEVLFCRNRQQAIWLNYEKKKVLRTFGPHPGVLSMAVSPDSHWMVTAGRHGVRLRLWDMTTGEMARELDSRDAVVGFSPDGRWLAMSFGYEVVLCDARDWRMRPGLKREVTSGLPGLIAFSPDGKWLAMLQSERLMQIVDVESNTVRASLPSPNPDYIQGFAFSPDNRRIAVTAGNEVQLWNLDQLDADLKTAGLGWNEAGSAQRNGPRVGAIRREHAIGYTLALLTGGGVLIAIIFAYAVFRRHRQWLRDYAQVEALALARDNDLKAAQAEILLSQKMKALGTLAAGVAHDFNNLLSVVRMANKSIRRERDLQPDVEESTRDIEEAVMEGKRLVQSMLGYSRNESEMAGPYSIAEVVEDTVALLTRQFLSGIDLRLSLDKGLPPASGSRSKLRQILLNLIVNAAEAMGGKGRLTIGLQAESGTRDAAVMLRSSASAPYARLIVADTGPGIAPEVLPRLFEPFFTTKNSGDQRGTGLGLSLVYALARQENIGIQISTKAGAGAEFHLLVPLDPAALETFPADRMSATRPSPGIEPPSKIRL